MRHPSRSVRRPNTGVGLAVVIAFVALACSGVEAPPSATPSAGASAGESSASPGKLGGTLRMLAWEGYDDPGLVARFEAETGAKVETTYVGSVDELYTKTKTSGASFDLVFPDSSALPRYISEGLVQALDRSRIPNLETMLPFWSSQTFNVVDGQLYAAPFASGNTPLLYDTTVFSTAPDSWGVLWDPAYKGRIVGLDDSNPMIVITAMYLGLPDPFTLTDSEFDQVRQALVAQRDLARQYYAGFDEGVGLFSSGEAVVGVSMEPGMYKDINEAGGNFAETIPSEGAIEWVDSAAIPVGAASVDLAYRYIDLALSPETQATFAVDYSFFPIVDVSSAVTPEQAAQLGDFDELSKRLLLLKAPEDAARRNQLWLEVRAGAS